MNNSFGKFYTEHLNGDYLSMHSLLELKDAPHSDTVQIRNIFVTGFDTSETIWFRVHELDKQKLESTIQGYTLGNYNVLQRTIKGFISILNDIIDAAETNIKSERSECFVSQDTFEAMCPENHICMGITLSRVDEENYTLDEVITSNEILNLQTFKDVQFSFWEKGSKKQDFTNTKKLNSDYKFSGAYKVINLLLELKREFQNINDYFESKTNQTSKPEKQEISTTVSLEERLIPEIDETNDNNYEPKIEQTASYWAEIIGLFGMILAALIGDEINGLLGSLVGLGVIIVYFKMKTA